MSEEKKWSQDEEARKQRLTFDHVNGMGDPQCVIIDGGFSVSLETGMRSEETDEDKDEETAIEIFLHFWHRIPAGAFINLAILFSSYLEHLIEKKKKKEVP